MAALADLFSSLISQSFNKEAFGRLLSFSSNTDSNSDSMNPQAEGDDRPAPAALEIEQGQPAIVAAGEEHGEPADFNKSVQMVALFLATTSFSLIMNPLPAANTQSKVYLVVAHTTFAYLSLFLGIGLALHSIFFSTTAATVNGNGRIVRAQKKAIGIAIVFIIVAFILHTCVLLPFGSLWVVWLASVIVAVVIVGYVLLDFGKDDARQAARGPPDIV